MKLQHIIESLNEAPIGDFETSGDFSKNSSFRKPKDRKIINNPKSQEVFRKKFSNTDHDFNFYFVNSPAANRHTEVGMVDMNWVQENLGEEVANMVNHDGDAISIIFTNNKGEKGVTMTPWIVAHRIAHVLTRPNVNPPKILEAYSDFIKQMSLEVFPLYGINDFPRNWRGFISDQRAMKIMQLFMYAAGDFRSARDKNLNNGAEAFHEMFAQYLTTGKVKLKEIPKQFGNRNFSASLQGNGQIQDFEMVEYNHALQSAADTLEWGLEGGLGAYYNKVFVM